MIWDFDKNSVRKSQTGKALILERMINYGPPPGKKIKLAEVKKYWDKLNLLPLQRKLFELLIWGKYQSSQKTKKLFWG